MLFSYNNYHADNYHDANLRVALQEITEVIRIHPQGTMAIHLIGVEIFQCGPKQTDCNPYSHVTGMAKNPNFQPQFSYFLNSYFFNKAKINLEV